MNAATSSPSKSLREVVMQFGFPIERFVPNRGPKMLGRLGGLLCVLAGIGVVSFWAPRSEDPAPWYSVGAALAGAGVVSIVLMRRAGGGLRVLICPRGLVLARPGQVDTCPWDQVKEVQEEGRVGGARGSGSGFVIERKDGARFTFNQGNVTEIRRFGPALLREVERRKIPWKVQG